MPTSDPNKTVFISYRRSVHKHLSMMLFKDLREHGFDSFRDSDTMGAGEFERIILYEIARRTHFVVLLSHGVLERCAEPGDWLRREIEYALATQRNIVPVLVDGFKFNDAEAYLTGELSKLKTFQAQPLYTEEIELYEVGFNKLVGQKLQMPVYIPPSPPATLAKDDIRTVEKIVEAAVNAPRPTQEELSAEQWFARAFAKRESGDLEGAIEDYTEAIRLNPDYAEAYNNRGVARRQQGDIQEAIADYDKAIELKPDYAEAYYNRGNARGQQGDVREAIADYDKAIELKPDFAEAHNNRGAAWCQQGDIQEAIADYDKVIELKPDSAEAISNRGEAFFAVQQYEKALADFKKADELSPDDSMILGGMAITHHALGNIDEAKRLWWELVKRGAQYRDAEWVRKELNWADALVDEARKLIAAL